MIYINFESSEMRAAVTEVPGDEEEEDPHPSTVESKDQRKLQKVGKKRYANSRHGSTRPDQKLQRKAQKTRKLREGPMLQRTVVKLRRKVLMLIKAKERFNVSCC